MNTESHGVPEPEFTFAFQPIADVVTRQIFSYEALIRGAHNEPASHILGQVSPGSMHRFDQDARVKAIVLAAQLGIDCHLNLNMMPLGLISSAESVRSTVEAANRTHFPVEHIVLEVLEGEAIGDPVHFAELINAYRGLGMMVAIDDFGAGYSGLNLLAEFQPDQIKLDMQLVRRIECNGPRQAIVRAVGQVCHDLGIDVIAEGVETVNEYAWLVRNGVHLIQGYLLAKPGFECLPKVQFPEFA